MKVLASILVTSIGLSGVVACTNTVGSVSDPPASGDPPESIRVFDNLYVPLTDDDRVVPTKLMKDLALDELAKALSPVLVVEGKPYRLAQPNSDLARAAQSGYTMGTLPVADAKPVDFSRTKVAMRSPRGSALGNLSLDTSRATPTIQVDWFFDPNNPGQPIYANNDAAEPGNAYPWLAEVYMQRPSGSPLCTGTYVGPHMDTLLTAAHCIVTGGMSNGYPIQFTPNAVGTGGTPYDSPFGTFNGCYYVWYPSGWGNCVGSEGDSCEQYDYAVVDFRPCGNPTIVDTMAVAITSGNNAAFYNIQLGGYPGAYWFQNGSPPDPVSANDPSGSGPTYPPCGTNVNRYNLSPLLCGTGGGSAQSNGSSFEVDSANLNDSAGESGAAMWGFNGSTAYEIAIMMNERSYFDFWQCALGLCYRDTGHLIDNNVWNFIRTYANY
jgi:Trypsin